MAKRLEHWDAVLMSSLEASRAKTSALREEETVSKVREADFGLSSLGSSKKSNPSTRSSKTSQPFALGDWSKYSGRSLRSGMIQNGIVYPLQPLVPLTRGTASGSWPTPAARDYRGANSYDTTLKKLSEGGRPHLDQLPNRVQLAEGRSIRGTLNPQWVEWLMGYPVGWTDLSNSATQ